LTNESINPPHNRTNLRRLHNWPYSRCLLFIVFIFSVKWGLYAPIFLTYKLTEMDELFDYLQANNDQLWANYCRLSDQWKAKLTFPAYCVAQFVKLQQLSELRGNMQGDQLIQLN
jgi:hypothetical protein